MNTSLFASGIWCNSVGVVSHQPQFGGKRDLDPLRPADPLSQFGRCADGKWIGVFDNDYKREREKFAKLFDLPELVEDPRCASLEELARTDAVVEIVEKINKLFLTRTSAEWRAYLTENSVSCEVMHCIRDVSTDEQALANGYVEELEFADGLKVMMPCPPVHFSEYGRRPYAPCGAIGEDTDEVLGGLGYSEADIAQMRERGAAKSAQIHLKERQTMKNTRRIIGILACGFLYSSMYLLPYIKYIFYDAVAEASGFNNTQIGLCLSVYIVASIISTLPSGYFSDKYSPKKLLIISGVGHSVLSFLYLFFIQNYAITLVIFFCMGITSVLLFWSPVLKAVSLAGKAEDQGKLYGWFEAFNGIGSMVFNFGALWVFSIITDGSVAALKGVVIFYAAMSVVSTFLVAWLYKPDDEAVAASGSVEKKQKATTREILAVLKMPKIWLFSLLIFGVYGFYVGSSYLTPYFSTVLGVSVVFSGSLATLKNYGTRLVGAPVAGAICDKIGRLKFIFFGFIVTIVLMVAFMLMPASNSALIPIMVLMFALALVNVSMKGVQFSVIDEMGVDPKVNGMAIAVATLVGFNLPDVALHPIIGVILDKYEAVAAYKIVFGLLLGMLVLGFIVTMILMVMEKKAHKSPTPSKQS